MTGIGNSDDVDELEEDEMRQQRRGVVPMQTWDVVRSTLHAFEGITSTRSTVRDAWKAAFSTIGPLDTIVRGLLGLSLHD